MIVDDVREPPAAEASLLGGWTARPPLGDIIAQSNSAAGFSLKYEIQATLLDFQVHSRLATSYSLFPSHCECCECCVEILPSYLPLLLLFPLLLELLVLSAVDGVKIGNQCIQHQLYPQVQRPPSWWPGCCSKSCE